MSDVVSGIALYQVVRAEIVLAWVTILVFGLLARQFSKRHYAAEFAIWFYLLAGIGTWAPSFLPAFWTEMGPSRLPDSPGVVITYWFLFPFLSVLTWPLGWAGAYGFARHDAEASEHLLLSLQIGIVSGMVFGFAITMLMRRWDRRSAARQERPDQV